MADLEHEHARSRVSYALRTLLGASTVLASPLGAAAAISAGGQMATRSLAYALDRDKLVRDHPLGFIHLASAEFGSSACERPRAGVITDPGRELVSMFSAVADGIAPLMDRIWPRVIAELESGATSYAALVRAEPLAGTLIPQELGGGERSTPAR